MDSSAAVLLLINVLIKTQFKKKPTICYCAFNNVNKLKNCIYAQAFCCWFQLCTSCCNLKCQQMALIHYIQNRNPLSVSSKRSVLQQKNDFYLVERHETPRS